MEEEVHPEDVDPDVVGVRPEPGWPKIRKGDVVHQVPGAAARVGPDDDLLGGKLEELRKVVGDGEHDDRNDEGFCGVDLPEKKIDNSVPYLLIL